MTNTAKATTNDDCAIPQRIILPLDVFSQWFRERLAEARVAPGDAGRQNGLACATCGGELVDTREDLPDQALGHWGGRPADLPNALRVHCPRCGLRAWRPQT